MSISPEPQDLPPVKRAVLEFVQAPDEAAARAVFERQRVLLQPYEAQQALDVQLTSDDPATQQRLAERRDLLRRLRGAAPAQTPEVIETSELIRRDAADRQYAFSAHAETGGTATVVNNVFIQGLERRWTRPVPPALDRDAVPRDAAMDEVKAELAGRGGVAITGKAAALAMQGAPGVGKTTLARLLALELEAEDDYSDGVIWEDGLGPDFTAPEQAQAVLRRWAGYATNFFELGDNLNKLFTFEPAAVRGLLSEHPRLLVVLDNVWSLAAIRPLRDALPPAARLIVTTRSRAIAQGLGAGWVEVGLLSEAEALQLFELRLGWQPRRDRPADGWAFDLATGVGLHPLGLDVALGVLRRYGDAAAEGRPAAEWRPTAERLLREVRGGRFERLSLGDDDPGHNVKAVLMFSYGALEPEAQGRFRRLGAFAAEADFTTEAAAAAWDCDGEQAFETLTGFANAALLERKGGGLWRQHALLRAFSLALLRDAGETDAAAAAHARATMDAMRRADDAQRFYEMLPALPQLRHAFAWALPNDLDLALDIAANCATLQKQFGLAREGGDWSERALAAAQARATPEALARAWGHRGNRLSAIAGLPGEDRRARLGAALAAYDEALQFRRPDTAPLAYAATQNNRANRLSEIAGLPGEDRRARTLQALQCAWEAYGIFVTMEHAPYQAVAESVLRGLRTECGDAFAEMWAAAGLGAPPAWLIQDDGASPMEALLPAFAAVRSGEEMVEFWRGVRAELEEPLMQAVGGLIAQAQQAGDTDTVEALQSRLDAFRQVRAQAQNR